MTTVLFLIFFSNRFMRFLADAAAGIIGNEAVFQLVAIKSVTSLPVLLPLALYLAVLVAMGRLYKDSEMTALAACGMGTTTVIKTVFFITVPISLLLLALSLYAVPAAQQWAAEIQTESRASADFLAITPGRFKTFDDDGLVIYTKDVIDQGRRLDYVFARHIEDQNVSVLSAAKAVYSYEKDKDMLFMVFKDGYRYEGAPGSANFKIVQFADYGVKVEQGETVRKQLPLSARPTSQLLRSKNLREQAELQWRIAMPLSAVLLALLSVLLSKADPRQGRFAKLFVAIVLYVIYTNLLGIAKNWVEQGKVPDYVGIWWVHGLVLLLIMALWVKQIGFKWLFQRLTFRAV